MRFEYLLFDLLVGVPPLLLGLVPRANFRHRIRSTLGVVAAVSLPFIAWDAAVAGRHWWFNPAHVTGVELFGLPIEEILFFVAVPYACVFTWETVILGRRGRVVLPSGVSLALSLFVPAGLAVAVFGPAYSGLALLAFGCAVVLDHAFGTALFRQPRFWAFLLLVSGFNLLFNGYLTWRPIVLYSPQAILGVRIGTVPVEDLVYGAALLSTAVIGYQWMERRRPRPSWLSRLIARRLGGYRHVLVEPDDNEYERLSEHCSVGIVGGGLAGLSAAALLADRGFRVVLIERNSYLGGKLASFEVELEDGFRTRVDHGFHAFFRHYYNLGRFLERIDVAKHLRPIGHYAISTCDGERIVFDDERSAPALNLLGLARTGLYDFREVALGPAGRELEAFLRYDPERTFSEYDDVSFAEFAQRASLPPRLLTVFTTFSRAFFADAERMSTAELIKSFHFYYLSHDLGLAYDYLGGSTSSTLLEPLRHYLQSRGVEIRCGAGARSLEGEHVDGGGRLCLDGHAFDEVILAADVAATARIVAGSRTVATQAPSLLDSLSSMRAGQPYAVLRIWTDKPSPVDTPVFLSTERFHWLDAVAFVDRYEPEASQWVREHGGSVLELHSYALPDDIPDAELERQVRESFVSELERHFPEMRGLRVRHAHLQLRRDFTAYHIGMADRRPGPVTELSNLYLCGDWVRLPSPTMLMEAAHTSALFVVNDILRKHGLRQERIEAVPPKGLLAGVPELPKRPVVVRSTSGSAHHAR